MSFFLFASIFKYPFGCHISIQVVAVTRMSVLIQQDIFGPFLNADTHRPTCPCFPANDQLLLCFDSSWNAYTHYTGRPLNQSL